MADKEITIKVTTDADTSELEDLQDLIEDIDKNSDIKVEVKADDDDLKETQQQIDEIDNENPTVEINVDSSSIEDARSSIDGLSQSIDAGSTSSENLNTNLDFKTDSIDNLSNNTWDLVKHFDTAGESASNFAGVLESAMLFDVANQIGMIGQQAENMAIEMDNASISIGQLATNTGVAEPQMRDLIANISNVTFPQSEAMAYVNALNQMGVSADQLGSSATNMDRINDATHIGYEKVIQLTQGLRGLGITADNLPASFDAIAYAQANVTGGADTLSMILKTQAGTINEYGLSIDQLVIIMQRLSEMGYSQRKMGSELSSILKENNGDLSAVEQQLGITSGALQNASQVTGEYAGKLQDLADEEMEHKTITERLGAVYEDFRLQLEPVLSPLMSLVGIIGQFGQTALAINSLITLAQTFGILTATEEGLTVAQWELNASMWANPVTWLVVAILILIGVLVWLYFNNEQFRESVNALGGTIMNVLGILYSGLIGFLQWLGGMLQNLIVSVGNTTANIIGTITSFLVFFATLPARVGNTFLSIISRAISFGSQFVSSIINAGTNAVYGFTNAIGQMSIALIQEFNHMLQSALEFAGRLPQIIWDTAVKTVWSWVGGSGEHSPGFMSEAFEGDIGYMEDRAKKSTLADNMSSLANSMVDGFNPNFTNAEIISNTGGASQVNNIYLTDFVVDNDDRIDRLCDEIAKRINWDNTTAGRSKDI